MKLELTYSCNLRCGFCYTDAPRHTLERTADLPDETWQGIVEQAIELGVIEAVVTGGEPLLRRELALGAIERLDAAGVAVTMNTNGWFVDEALADRFAVLEHASVNVSIDGATPELHDRLRGVPGSWRRAVRAMSLLLDRDVTVRIVHVVTPQSEPFLAELVDQARTLGVSALRVTTVVPIGAAARGSAYGVHESRVRRELARAQRRMGDDLAIVFDGVNTAGDPVQAPVFMLVRPNGAVMSGTLSPFSFGHAHGDGLAECWERIRRDWRHERIEAWREPILRGRSVADMPVVIYRDDEVDVYGSPSSPSATEPAPRLPKLAPATQVAGDGDVLAAGAHVRELALARAYRSTPVRWSPGPNGSRYVRGASGEVALLNATAATVMDACDGGTAAAAARALAERYRSASPDRLEEDALTTVRSLRRRGILVAAPPVQAG